MNRDAQPSPADQDIEVRLRPVLRIGLMLARSGAAAFRVRAVVERAASSLGLSQVECIVTPSSIIVSVWDRNVPWTRMARLKELGVNMGRMRRLDHLSRTLKAGDGPASATDLTEQLDAIEREPLYYPRWLTVPMLGAACAAFCGAIHGNEWQMIAAFVGASAGHTLRLFMHRRHFQVVSLVVACSLVSCLVSYLGSAGLAAFAGSFDPGRGMLASVLYLVPGVPLVTSLLDVIHGDYEAGLARAAFASLLVVCLSVGVLAGFAIAGIGR